MAVLVVTKDGGSLQERRGRFRRSLDQIGGKEKCRHSVIKT